MLVYVEYKIDLESPNKINILRVREEKDPTIKYTISKCKYRLKDIKLDDNFNQDQVFFTRVNIGNSKANTVKILVYDEITNEEQYEKLIIYMFGSSIPMIKEIKATHEENLFLDENYLPIFNVSIIEKELNKLVKEIKKDNIQNKVSRRGYYYTLYLSEINVE